MRNELSNEELGQISGGRYFIDNRSVVYFETIDNDGYQLKGEGARYQAQAIMDGLIGKYNSQSDYDNACLDALNAAGLL